MHINRWNDEIKIYKKFGKFHNNELYKLHKQTYNFCKVLTSLFV